VSSSTSKRKVAFYRSTAHPLLAIFVPLSFLLTLDSLLKTILTQVSVPFMLLFPILLVVGVEEATASNLFFKERTSSLVRLRELLLILLISIPVLFLTQGITFRPLHLWRIDIVYPLIMVLVQWSFTLTIHNRLRERELFLSVLAGKSGAQQIRALRDSSLQAGYAVKNVRLVRAAILMLQVLIFILIIATLALKRTVSSATLVLAAVHAVIGLLFSGVAAFYMEDQFYLGNGFFINLRLERRRLIAIAGLIGLCLLLALLAAGDSSLLPLSWLLSLLKKLAGLFRFEADRSITREAQQLLWQRQSALQSLPPLQHQTPSVLWPLILELLKQFLRILVFLALFFFLAAPLFSQYFLKRVSGLRPLNFLLKKLARFWRYLRRMSRLFAHWLGTTRNKEKRDGLKEDYWRAQPFSKRSRSRSSRKKKLQMGKVLKAFAALIKRGEDIGLRFFTTQTPQEYTDRLAAKLPESREHLGFVVEVFEEVMFSNHLVDRERVQLYLRTVRRLCG